jgi:hypothetical protein
VIVSRRATAQAALAVGALGVVFGDIGTSPLYTVETVFNPRDPHPVTVSRESIFGVVSLIFWSVMIIVTVTYIVLVMRADNDGEGGIMALITLIRRRGMPGGRRAKVALAALGIFGASLFFGDSVITPAISVLSAIEGVKVAAPYLDDSWGPIIDRDVEGRDSTPAAVDRDRSLYGQRSVTQRLARTIFIGSAATLRTPNKGIDKQRIWLGSAVPGDTTGHFESALHLLAERATYLYAEGDRYWYDTSQSVTKTVRDIADGLIGQPDIGEPAPSGAIGQHSEPGGTPATGPFGGREVSRFFGVMKISGQRYGKALKDLQLEILPHLDDPETKLEITLEIRAHRDGGFSEDKRRVVSENAQVLKFEQADFES